MGVWESRVANARGSDDDGLMGAMIGDNALETLFVVAGPYGGARSNVGVSSQTAVGLLHSYSYI